MKELNAGMWIRGLRQIEGNWHHFLFTIMSGPPTSTNAFVYCIRMNICDDDIHNILEGYTSFSAHGKRRSRHGRNPRGVAVFIRNCIKQLIQCTKVTEYAIYLHMNKTCIEHCYKDIIIVCTYILCENSTFLYQTSRI